MRTQAVCWVKPTLSHLPTHLEPVSCEFEPSLFDQNTDIENLRPETGARNRPGVARNREKIALRGWPLIANPRECRADFCELDMAHGDGTGWLAW